MTTGREDTRPARVVVVGADRPEAAQVFGGAFDRMLTTTYDELVADLAAERTALEEAGLGPDPVRFVGVAAGPGMQAAVDEALAMVRTAAAAGEDAPELAVEVPWDLDALDHLRQRLTSPGAPPISDVRRYRDRPCLVLGGPPAPTTDPAWVVNALLTVGTTAPDARVAEQQRVAADWERASAHAQLERKDAELERVRRRLVETRRKLQELEGPRDGKGGGGPRRGRRAHGSSAAAASPAAAPPPTVVGLLAAVGRRTGLGVLGGAVVVALVAAAAVAVPALVLAAVAGRVGVAIGLALGVTLVACAVVATLVLVGQRRTAARLEALQDAVGRQGRTADQRGRDLRRAMRRTGRDLAGQKASLRGVARNVRRLHDQVRTTAKDEGLVTRRQVQAVVNLAAMVPLRGGVPALGGWAASPDFAVEVVDRLLTERPRVVVEAGSGASTLLLALAAREHGLDTRIVSLDHDAHFAARTRELLERHGVADRAEVRWAPLARTHVVGHLTPWYDEEALADLHDVGLLVVDGPPTGTGPAARYPAVPLLQDRLAARCTIVVDDTGRQDDREVVDRWARLLPDFDRTDLPLEKGASILRRG
ncbi:class I SAM-dependent methyltransferase [Nocardioides sp. SYSU DS0663]|uniref:class I SAM-dependent methyltransferase n=1 Tax=Nocardioides sp. SYSU DS0663 TaxID=3416445 RepID=UPI003F4C8DDE